MIYCNRKYKCNNLSCECVITITMVDCIMLHVRMIDHLQIKNVESESSLNKCLQSVGKKTSTRFLRRYEQYVLNTFSSSTGVPQIIHMSKNCRADMISSICCFSYFWEFNLTFIPRFVFRKLEKVEKHWPHS